MFEVIRDSDMVLLLISDGAQAETLRGDLRGAASPAPRSACRTASCSGTSTTVGSDFPDNVDVIAVCPKGMGASVRALYVQGADVNGAGINASFAMQQDVTGRAVDRALGWAVGLGSPYTFQTTLRSEYLSDIFGERGILLGAVHGIVESLYRRFRDQGMSDEDAFQHSAESVTGPISRIISRDGMLGVYRSLDADDRKQSSPRRTPPPTRSVLEHPARDLRRGPLRQRDPQRRAWPATGSPRFPMGKIDQAEMWQVGQKVRARPRARRDPARPVHRRRVHRHR